MLSGLWCLLLPYQLVAGNNGVVSPVNDGNAVQLLDLCLVLREVVSIVISRIRMGNLYTGLAVLL